MTDSTPAEQNITEAGKTSQRTGPATTIGATSLGDPRDAEDQSARMIAAIEAAKRGR